MKRVDALRKNLLMQLRLATLIHALQAKMRVKIKPFLLPANC
jgi:hypothetical protein